MYRGYYRPVVGMWFSVCLACSHGPAEAARLLQRALSAQAHEVSLATDEEGAEFIAVLVRATDPAAELERLMRQAGLRGYFDPLPWTGRT